MARSKETFGKKEVRNKKAKQRQEKEQRKLQRKEQGKKSFDDMIAYVDENGMITDTPPDPTKKKKIDASKIETSVLRKELREEVDNSNRGKIIRFDDSLGYGFILDQNTKNTIFVHVNDTETELKNGMMVRYETERTPKGMKAIKVTADQ